MNTLKEQRTKYKNNVKYDEDFSSMLRMPMLTKKKMMSKKKKQDDPEDIETMIK